jgi:hypothetical protein
MSGLNEKQVPTEEPVEVTLEGVNRKVLSLAEGMNRMYETIMRNTEEVMFRKQLEDEQKEKTVAHGFNVINTSIASFTARFDVIFKELTEKVGSDNAELVKESEVKTKLILDEQQKIMEEYIAVQEAQLQASTGVSDQPKA